MNDLNVPASKEPNAAGDPKLPAETQRQDLVPRRRAFPLATSSPVSQVVRRHYGKLLFVVLPTVLAAIYFFLIAADMYASEARFIVRSPSRAPSTGVSGFLQSSGITRAQDDVYSVQDFATSRDAIAALSEHIDLREIFGREEADWAARFPNAYDRDNAEDFYRYYKRRVSVDYDTTTGIVKMEVLAFRAEDAQKVALHLLDAAEALVNRLNERARSNAVKNAELQMGLSEKAVAEAQAKLLDYRTRELMLDPGKASDAMFETLARVQEEQQATRLRIAELSRRSPNSPLIADLRDRLRELDRQVLQQRQRLAGGNSSMAPKISEYEQLSLRLELATKEYGSALASLENARADARRQQIYLDRVVTPNLPDRALYPRRFRAVFIVFVTCFLVYSIGALLIAGVREHAQD